MFQMFTAEFLYGIFRYASTTDDSAKQNFSHTKEHRYTGPEIDHFDFVDESITSVSPIDLERDRYIVFGRMNLYYIGRRAL